MSVRRAVIPMLAALSTLFAADTRVLFDPYTPRIGPFPTDFLTASDPNQKTGRTVDLPKPDCTVEPSTCSELTMINQLDGFNLQPRLNVSFSAPINPDTLRAGLWLVWLENLTQDEYGLQRAGHVTPINQVSYEPQSHAAFAKPDEFLDQHRRYALVVTDAVLDMAGAPVKADSGYLGCVAAVPNDYCNDLARVPAMVNGHRVVGASVFTTMSVTDFMEKARRQLVNVAANPQPTGVKSYFNVNEIASMDLHFQMGADPSKLSEENLPLSLLAGIGHVAFGMFQSPMFLNAGYTIPQTPTGLPDVSYASVQPVYFHVLVPATQKPAAGYPVIVFGHGFGSNRFEEPTAEASVLVQAGFAVIAINVFGHGYGPNGKVTITQTDGRSFDLPAGGRGQPLSPGGSYGGFDGCVLAGIFGARDCLRQTVIDQMQLVRAITNGLDLDGDGTPDLDPSRIYYAGHSFGAMYGTMLTAVEPNISAAVLNSGGGTLTDIARTSNDFRIFALLDLLGRSPSLTGNGLNFEDGYTLRYQPVNVLKDPAVLAVQEFFERTEWYGTPGDAIGYAPHLASSTLPNVPIKPVLFQYGIGDSTVPNPSETNLVRAANMRLTTTVLRWDVARAIAPQLQQNPHFAISAVTGIDSAAAVTVANALQVQMAGYLASGGAQVSDVNGLVLPFFGKPLFEIPSFLTESFNLLP
jgi:pimeloyl-ACP methyl ester carboxylesterase